MTTLKEIETAIEQLSEAELAELRRWWDERDAQAFDERIARDAASGKLDDLAAQALAEHAAGRTRPL